MNEENITKKYLDQKFDEKLEPILYDVQKNAVLLESLDSKIDSVIEMLVSNLEKTGGHEETIIGHEAILIRHDKEIKELQQI